MKVIFDVELVDPTLAEAWLAREKGLEFMDEVFACPAPR